MQKLQYLVSKTALISIKKETGFWYYTDSNQKYFVYKDISKNNKNTLQAILKDMNYTVTTNNIDNMIKIVDDYFVYE